MSSFIILLFFSDLLFGQTKKEQIVIDFLYADIMATLIRPICILTQTLFIIMFLMLD
ncbi:MAG: hypothetical protein Ct9H300mP2_5310 [Candidatus Neomarinimicrobiota bacterium]|nr:MAG: hypothetical protein Ct9H300mP2_5310 [Candidatus Neomarinimicrobiota bacterium]